MSIKKSLSYLGYQNIFFLLSLSQVTSYNTILTRIQHWFDRSPRRRISFLRSTSSTCFVCLSPKMFIIVWNMIPIKIVYFPSLWNMDCCEGLTSKQIKILLNHTDNLWNQWRRIFYVNLPVVPTLLWLLYESYPSSCQLISSAGIIIYFSVIPDVIESLNRLPEKNNFALIGREQVKDKN